MTKQTAFIFSYDVFVTLPQSFVDSLKNHIIVISHNAAKLAVLKPTFQNNKKRHVCSRKNIRALIDKNKNNFNFIISGISEYDMYLAANNKFVLINPAWLSNVDVKVTYYGIPVSSIENLKKYISVFENSNTWYEELNIGPNTIVRSLMNARTGSTSPYESSNEIALIQNFHNLLKLGKNPTINSISYFDILYYYLSSMIAKDTDMQQITDWAIFPSSNTSLNSEMNTFKERIRYLMNGKKKEPLFIRYEPITKSHTLSTYERLPCDRHFGSLHINPYYQQKLNGHTICVLDDYLTNGTSFETARNLLLHENVKQIYFIALGSFSKNYTMQNYELSGDLYSPNYTYKLITRSEIIPKFNSDALSMIEQLSQLI